MRPLEETLANVPGGPGVYIFKDAGGRTLYVGKAKNLWNRVHSYFQKGRVSNPRLELLRSKIADLDYFIANSETQALLLEYNLIKEHHPPFNIEFRDDKRLPLIKVVVRDPFPYITVARRREDDGNRYFGPYVSSRDMRRALKVIRQVFQIRSCTMKITGHERSCLYYHLKECTAPCVGAVNREDYLKSIQGVLDFLEGNAELLIGNLTRRMNEAAGHLEFERAALIRNQLEALKQIRGRPDVSLQREEEEDYVGIAVEKGLAAACVVHVRRGGFTGEEHFVFEPAEWSRELVLAAFLEKYFRERPSIPGRVVIPFPLEETPALESFLSKESGHPVRVTAPQRGNRKKMLNLAEKNAAHQLGLALLKENRKHGMLEALEELRRILKLPAVPFRIEGYDISNLFGQEATASMAVFQGGWPDKKQYRKFAIVSKSTPDDFAMMEEVLTRRLSRLSDTEEDESFAAAPDLILLDGGRGQLSSGIKVLQRLGRTDIPLASLAKEEEEIYYAVAKTPQLDAEMKHKVAGGERPVRTAFRSRKEGGYLPESPRPLKLERHHPGLKILQQVRDEAHRFAIGYHKTRRDKKISKSVLEEIPGIGPKRAQKLFEAFGSPDQIKVAQPEQIAEVLGCPKSLAEKILSALTC